MGREAEFIQKLKENPAFQKILQNIRDAASAEETTRPYAFHYWNPSGMELIVRDKRKARKTVRVFDPEKLGEDPVVVMANVAMLYEQMPENLRATVHRPAYFDDSQHIQSLLFKVTKTGVKMTDELYRKIREAYLEINDQFSEQPPIPLMIGSTFTHPHSPAWARAD